MQTLTLRTAKDYSTRLAVHVNHLNKVLKEITGQTITGEITTQKVIQEAKQQSRVNHVIYAALLLLDALIATPHIGILDQIMQDLTALRTLNLLHGTTEE